MLRVVRPLRALPLLVGYACSGGPEGDGAGDEVDSEARAETDAAHSDEPADTEVPAERDTEVPVERDTEVPVERDTDVPAESDGVHTDTASAPDTDRVETDTDRPAGTDLPDDTDSDVPGGTDVPVDTASCVDHGGCDPLVTCTPGPTGPTCGDCPPGYAGDGASACVDPLACATDEVQGAVDAGAWAVAVPASCGGSTPVCCPGGVPLDDCGPVALDLTEHPGDAPRLVLTPVAGTASVDVLLRARAATVAPLPVTILGAACEVTIDATAGTFEDVEVRFRLAEVEPPSGDPYVVVTNVAIAQLEDEDVAIGGGPVPCGLASFSLGFFVGSLADTLAGSLDALVCDTCPCAPAP